MVMVPISIVMMVGVVAMLIRIIRIVPTTTVTFREDSESGVGVIVGCAVNTGLLRKDVLISN